MKVKLKHSPNPDIPGGYWRKPVDKSPRLVEVSTFAEASQECLAYIDRNGLGSGNWTGGQVYSDPDTQIAQVSYNGRVWDMAGAELPTG